MSRYYISDCHFFHDALNRQMDCRGFADAEDMNRVMLERWNARVKKKDEVYILGDFSYGNAEETNRILDAIHGRLFLLRGNHDRFIKSREAHTDRFEWIRDYAEVHDNNRRVILCHYPVMFYNGQYRRQPAKTGGFGDPADIPADDRMPRTWMLYGHVHDTVDERLMRQFIAMTRKTVRTDREGQEYHIPCQMINCYCGYSDYVPLSLDEWIENDRKRQEGSGTGP